MIWFQGSPEPGRIYRLKVKPDITVRTAEKLVSIVNEKYKKAAGAYENRDFYQVISYAQDWRARVHI